MLTTLKGSITPDVFVCESGTRIHYVTCKNFFYPMGDVYALFEICGSKYPTYVLLETVPSSNAQ